MAYQKLASLTKKLSEKTKKGEVDWEETAEKGVYQASFSDYSLHLSKIGEGVNIKLLITIYDEEGQVMEQFDDEDIDPFFLDENIFAVMKEMYEFARRRAMGTEQAINKILRILEDDESPF